MTDSRSSTPDITGVGGRLKGVGSAESGATTPDPPGNTTAVDDLASRLSALGPEDAQANSQSLKEMGLGGAQSSKATPTPSGISNSWLRSESEKHVQEQGGSTKQISLKGVASSKSTVSPVSGSGGLASRLSAPNPEDLRMNNEALKEMGLKATVKTEPRESSQNPPVDLTAQGKRVTQKMDNLERPADGKSNEPVVTEDSKDEPSDAARLLQHLSHQVEIKLADHQADPNSPLYSAKTFEELHLSPALLKGLYMMGFQRPSKIQERALPLLLSNPPQNLIGQSQSGTGKTAAFVLTMLTRIDPTILAPQAICIAPSRELARQIMEVAELMSRFLNITKCLACQGTLTRGQKIAAQLIVGTPGTLKDALSSHRIEGTPDPVLSAKDVKVLVTDEADVLIGTGSLGDQTLQVKNNIKKRNKNFQIVLFSATFPDHVQDYASRFAPGANEIKLPREELTVDGIKQFYMDCDNEQQKFEVLVELYHILTIGQSIIFAQHRRTADEIARRMNADGHLVAVLHGAQDGEGRDATIDNFRSGKQKVLITTNVIARGIDISQVNMVINYDLPMDPVKGPDSETYLHRIGRTGRFGRTGISINFISDRASFQAMMQIKSDLGIADDQLIHVQTQDFDLMEKTLKAAMKA